MGERRGVVAVAGTIAEIQGETTFGEQIRVTPSVFPAVTIIVFHVRHDANIGIGSVVAAGQRLGTHIGTQVSGLASSRRFCGQQPAARCRRGGIGSSE
jgi:hypothetical protein